MVEDLDDRLQFLPVLFCWTRFGTEAGETVDAILGRKERERRENGGVFLWGIGNSIAPGIIELIRQVSEPEVLFSPIKGQPRRVDVAPARVVEWRVGETITGHRFNLPSTFHVRGGSGTETMSPRYALVCASDEPLAVFDHGRLNFGSLRNLLSGNQLGASQVTAVVRRLNEGDGEGRDYLVAMRARLVEPFFIRLREPVPRAVFAKEPRSTPRPCRPVARARHRWCPALAQSRQASEESSAPGKSRKWAGRRRRLV